MACVVVSVVARVCCHGCGNGDTEGVHIAKLEIGHGQCRVMMADKDSGKVIKQSLIIIGRWCV